MIWIFHAILFLLAVNLLWALLASLRIALGAFFGRNHGAGNLLGWSALVLFVALPLAGAIWG